MEARYISLHPMTIKMLRRLMREAERDGQYRIANRIHAIILNSGKRTSTDIADILDVSRGRVSEWLRNYDDFGIEGLLEGHRKGRPPRLTDKQLGKLDDIIDSGPVAYGYSSGIWDGPRVAEVIFGEFGVEYDPRHVRRILDQLGFSVQRPTRFLSNADSQKQLRWRRYKYPNIKKKRERKVQH